MKISEALDLTSSSTDLPDLFEVDRDRVSRIVLKRLFVSLIAQVISALLCSPKMLGGSTNGILSSMNAR